MAIIPPENGVIAAPMAGFSDVVYRRWAFRFGADMAFTGMISAEGLRRKNRKTIALLEPGDTDRPVGAQLFDDRPRAVADAARMVRDAGFDFIDINLGCPARKIVGKSSGAWLMREPKLAAGIVRSAARAVDIPVSAKIRSGWNEDDAFMELIPMLVDAGVSFISFHPRSRRQMFTGSADWDQIARAVEISSVPIVGNGDIGSGDDAKRMIESTGCTAVMIGRASLGNPWIFSDTAAVLSGKHRPLPPSDDEKLNACAEYVIDILDYYGEEHGTRIARKIVTYFTRGIPGCKAIRAAAHNANNRMEILDSIYRTKAVSLAV